MRRLWCRTDGVDVLGETRYNQEVLNEQKRENRVSEFLKAEAQLSSMAGRLVPTSQIGGPMTGYQRGGPMEALYSGLGLTGFQPKTMHGRRIPQKLMDLGRGTGVNPADIGQRMDIPASQVKSRMPEGEPGSFLEETKTARTEGITGDMGPAADAGSRYISRLTSFTEEDKRLTEAISGTPAGIAPPSTDPSRQVGYTHDLPGEWGPGYQGIPGPGPQAPGEWGPGYQGIPGPVPPAKEYQITPGGEGQEGVRGGQYQTAEGVLGQEGVRGETPYVPRLDPTELTPEQREGTISAQIEADRKELEDWTGIVGQRARSAFGNQAKAFRAIFEERYGPDWRTVGNQRAEILKKALSVPPQPRYQEPAAKTYVAGEPTPDQREAVISRLQGYVSHD